MLRFRPVSLDRYVVASRVSVGVGVGVGFSDDQGGGGGTFACLRSWVYCLLGFALWRPCSVLGSPPLARETLSSLR